MNSKFEIIFLKLPESRAVTIFHGLEAIHRVNEILQ